MRGLIEHAGSYNIQYTAADGTRYTKPLLDGQPRMVFKEINNCIGLTFKFACPYFNCEPCHRSASANKESKLKGEKRSSCAFQRSIKVVDAYLFTNSSMANMINDLHVMRKNTNMPLQKTFPRTYTYMMDEGHDQSTFELVCEGKMEFPYERVNTWSDMEEKQIPTRSDFASSLRDSDGLSPQQYTEFCNLWRKLKIRNLADLLRVYNILGENQLKNKTKQNKAGYTAKQSQKKKIYHLKEKI